MHHFASILIIGIQLGSIYALIAIGYTMVYGVLKLINFAHGDVYMVGAYGGLFGVFLFGSWFPRHLHLTSLIPSPVGAVVVLLLSMACCALLGLIIEQAAYRPLRQRSAWIAPAIVVGGVVAYVAYEITGIYNKPTAVAIGVGLLAWILVGMLLYAAQRGNRPAMSTRLTALITAIGVSLFLENFGQLKQIFSADTRFFPPNVTNMPDNLHVGGAAIPTSTFLIFTVSIVLVIILTLIITRTKIGKAVRAVSYDLDAAALMGINTDRVISFTFALGAALAGAAGVMVTALTGTQFTPMVGIMPGMKAFVAAVLGGIGSIPGAMLGGLIMGLAETLVVAYGPAHGVPSTYRDAVAFLLLIVILMVRPAGLLGRLQAEKV